MRQFLSFTALFGIAASSFCGQASVPFTFQVLRAGYPVLGCARPRCFGWTANGTRVADGAQFFRINGKEDGYLRRSDVLLRQPFKAKGFVPQISNCEIGYRRKGCDVGQWVGGLAPEADPFSKTLQTRCCSYGPLFNSEDRGIAQLHPGQMVVGGEVTSNGRLIAFDYIANLNKIVVENGTIIYNVHVRRMACFDDDDNTSTETITSNNAIINNNQRGLEQNPLDINPTDIELQTVQEPPHHAMAAPIQTFAQSSRLQSPSPLPPPSPQYAPPTSQDQQQVPPAPQQYQYPQRSMPQPSQSPALTLSQQLSSQYQQYSQNQQSYPQFQPPQQYQAQTQPPPPPQTVQEAYERLPLLPGLPPVQQQNIQQISSPPQTNALNSLFPALFPQQPQQNLINGMAQMPTLPPLQLPRLEDIPKIDIPSIEDVEQSIPPVQKAILTSVARFFGVL